MISIAYFGTHEFSAVILETFIKSGEFNIVKIITQPDRPAGRKQEMQISAVKRIALQNNLKIDQPENLKGYSVGEPVDVNIVCQYGLIIPKTILDAPRFKSINVHTSLLPKYRGASPIQTALINGDTTTGVTIMQMDEKMDTGPILAQKEVPVDNSDTYPTLSAKMAPVAANLLISTAQNWIGGKITPQPQNDALASYCQLLTRADGEIKWDKPANEIYNLYRGLYPWPGIWTTWQGKRLKLLEVKLANDLSGVPAGICARDEKLFGVCAQNTAIEILQAQMEGKKPMSASEFINGFKKILC